MQYSNQQVISALGLKGSDVRRWVKHVRELTEEKGAVKCFRANQVMVLMILKELEAEGLEKSRIPSLARSLLVLTTTESWQSFSGITLSYIPRTNEIDFVPTAKLSKQPHGSWSINLDLGKIRSRLYRILDDGYGSEAPPDHPTIKRSLAVQKDITKRFEEAKKRTGPVSLTVEG